MMTLPHTCEWLLMSVYKLALGGGLSSPGLELAA